MGGAFVQEVPAVARVYVVDSELKREDEWPATEERWDLRVRTVLHRREDAVGFCGAVLVRARRGRFEYV